MAGMANSGGGKVYLTQGRLNTFKNHSYTQTNCIVNKSIIIILLNIVVVFNQQALFAQPCGTRQLALE